MLQRLVLICLKKVNYSDNWLIVLVTFQVKMLKICLFQLLKFDTICYHLMRVNEESFDGEKEEFEGITFASGIWESIFHTCV